MLPLLESQQLKVGDTIYLLKAAGSYTSGFQLQYTPASHTSTSSQAAAVGGNPTQSSTATAGSPSSVDADAPAAKRYKSATPVNPPPPPPAATATAAAAAPAAASLANAAAARPEAVCPTEQHASRSAEGRPADCMLAEAGTFSAAIAAAAQAGAPDPAAPSTNSSSEAAVSAVQQRTLHAVALPHQQQQQQLFAGVRLVDWDGHHTHLALTRAAEEGAVVGQVLDSSTTHILARWVGSNTGGAAERIRHQCRTLFACSCMHVRNVLPLQATVGWTDIHQQQESLKPRSHFNHDIGGCFPSTYYL
jgi:hypothetical protein